VTPAELAALPKVLDAAALDVTLPPVVAWSPDGHALWYGRASYAEHGARSHAEAKATTRMFLG